MHHFHYRASRLYCEDVPLSAIAETVGTPCYVYSKATLSRHYQAFDSAFAGSPHLVCFSAKANTSKAILNLLGSLGSGLDIVSGGELHRGLSAGIPASRIVYSGVGKTASEMDMALSAGILMFNVESFEELHLLNERALRLGKRAPVSLRVNPDVDRPTHPYISTGLKKNKFGVDKERALAAYLAALELPGIEIRGIDFHIGSQITNLSPFVDAVDAVTALLRDLKRHGIEVRFLDVGGGLGITYGDETPPLPADYVEAVKNALANLPVTLIVEPGRAIVGNAGILLTRVLYRKEGSSKEFVIVDSGMNDLLRPSIYGAFHAIWPVSAREGAPFTADVVGPICESGDFLAKDRQMQPVAPGDLLAVMIAGAYGFSMSSNYNSRPRAAEVMVSGDRFVIVRERESYEDLTRGETVFPG